VADNGADLGKPPAFTIDEWNDWILAAASTAQYSGRWIAAYGTEEEWIESILLSKIANSPTIKASMDTWRWSSIY
jgi:hypothetical protein